GLPAARQAATAQGRAPSQPHRRRRVPAVGGLRMRASAATLHRAAIGLLCGALSACTLAPPYERPSTPAPPAYKEAPAPDSTWLPAAPADALDRGPWWQLFGDPTLTGLAEQVE